MKDEALHVLADSVVIDITKALEENRREIIYVGIMVVVGALSIVLAIERAGRRPQLAILTLGKVPADPDKKEPE